MIKSTLLQKIQQLETVARQLEPDMHERQNLGNEVLNYAENFINTIYDVNAYNTLEDGLPDLLSSPISEEPLDISKTLNLLKEHVNDPGLNPASHGHLGYIPGGGIYTSALGDYLADVTNEYAGISLAGPGAVQMENMLIDWMAKIVGYPVTTGGNLASGGSIANLIAIVTARDAFGIKSKSIPKTVIYSTAHAHHCMNKSFRIAGLDECVQRVVPMDENFRMDEHELEKLIVVDKKKGLKPWMIVASAGTTDVGAVDPLDAIASIAKKYNIWFHIDGAYGGFFILTKEGKKKLKGIEKSDSLVLDPHKGLFLPYGLGVVLVKDRDLLKDSHYYMPNYLQDALEEKYSPANLSPELTKHFRGLRLWLPLKLHGLKPFKACLEEKLLLARYFYQEVQKIDGFETLIEPELSVVSFRYLPKSGSANQFNEKLIKEIHKDGRVFLSSTTIDGTFVLRLAILAFRSHKWTVDLTLKILKEMVELIAN
ncbi:MAG: amino acid decarboxylase [Flavobacteriales bacterium]|nr:MAG: amino acid decarboxylase [Flavobacteriales bacterium]